ncbi:hypothetical protein G6F40_016193 [Rhizopus arrhizus]|nr:hypothetical protein G6F40_016193 [Rhizopus arrhizus]
MPGQFPWVRRQRMGITIARRAHHQLALPRRYRHRDHVLGNDLAQTHACIEARADDIERFIGHGDVQLQLRIARSECRQHRAGQERLGNGGDGKPQLPGHDGLPAHAGLQRIAQFRQRRADRYQQCLPGIAWRWSG